MDRSAADPPVSQIRQVRHAIPALTCPLKSREILLTRGPHQKETCSSSEQEQAHYEIYDSVPCSYKGTYQKHESAEHPEHTNGPREYVNDLEIRSFCDHGNALQCCATGVVQIASVEFKSPSQFRIEAESVWFEI